MKGKLFIFKFVCVLVMCFLSYPSLAIMEAMSTQELTLGSVIVVMGEVEDIEARWSLDGKIILTSVTIGNIDVISGETGHENVIVEYPGGAIGDIELKVSDTPSFSKGEKVILFLKSAQSEYYGDVYNIVGKAQGKYTIGDDGIARKEGFFTVSREEVIDSNIPVDELVNKIRRVK